MTMREACWRWSEGKDVRVFSFRVGDGIFERILRACAGISFAFVLASGCAHAGTLFVSAGAAPGGNGSEKAPFNSLAAVERASAPGDEIVVLPSPMSVPPLDGGIALKSHQKLTGRGPSVTDGGTLTQAPRITNSSAASNSGDAVELADYTEVTNLVIVNSYRGGIYGSDVTEVKVHGNNLSGTNTSCTPGFFVMFPGNIPLLPNGWAAIMADEDKGAASLWVWKNEIHDGTCNDGIDIRATGTAEVMARVESNNIAHLAQGPKMRSLLGIGMQTRDTAVLTVESDHNSETYIGSPDADCEGLFTNQTGGSLTWNINHNTFAHGIGGVSCNGGEFFVSGGPALTNLYISHSSFEDNPGDMLEQVNEATGSTMNLTLEDVTVRHTTQLTPRSPEPKFSSGFSTDVNLSRCMDESSHGHQNVSNFRMIHSHFSDCAGDGIGSIVNGAKLTLPPSLGLGTNAIDFGDGVGDSLSIEIEDSTIMGTQQDALHFMNQTAMRELTIRVENSQLGDAKGPAIIAFDQNGSTEQAEIDLGGKEPDSAGANCFIGAATLAAEVTGYDVFAKSNWWGRPEGPLPAQVSETDGNLELAPVLRVPPRICRDSK
jgi:hypothetical protein